MRLKPHPCDSRRGKRQSRHYNYTRWLNCFFVSNCYAMDQRLFDAARTGNISALHELLNEDPLILEKVCLSPYAETPLHVATLAGQTDLAMEMIKLMPSFAMELNKDGFSPMHMASARGHIEIVIELLKLDTGSCNGNQCLIKDKGSRIPLHCAVIWGRIPVIKELIFHCPQSMQEVTALGETVLHLAVKNSQFDALKLLIEKLKELDCFETILSTRDSQNKTFFELARVTGQVQVLELIKEECHVAIAENDQRDDTVSIMSTRNEIGECSQADHPVVNTSHMSPDLESNHRQNDQQEEPTEVTKPREIDLHNLILVAAVLIATMTYQAGLSPPPTIWREGANLSLKCLLKKEKLFLWRMRDCPAVLYYYFMLFNTAGFTSSCSLMMLVLMSYKKHKEVRLLGMSIMALKASYLVLLISLSPNFLSAFVIVLSLPIIMVVLYCLSAPIFNIGNLIIRNIGRIRRE